MAQWDKLGRLHGMMKVEDSHKNWNQQYLVLDRENQTLKFYDDYPDSLPKSYTCKEIELNFISKVSDARKVRPKAGFCFAITHTGDQIYLQANNEKEMLAWIDQLNDACRVTVPQTQSPTLAPEYSRNVVAGGVLVTMHNHESGDESVEHHMPALSMPSIKSGYGTKQGAVRKSWKRRFFLLNTNGLSYFKHDQEKEPIKTIPLADIREARMVVGQHHSHRQNLFEVVTVDRIFYIQCDSYAESQSWISHINKLAKQDVTSDDFSPMTYKSSTGSLEPVKPGRSVWEQRTQTLPVERRTKSNVRGTKKSWQLW